MICSRAPQLLLRVMYMYALMNVMLILGSKRQGLATSFSFNFERLNIADELSHTAGSNCPQYSNGLNDDWIAMNPRV